jgi:hypothetical protein
MPGCGIRNDRRVADFVGEHEAIEPAQSVWGTPGYRFLA